jgi:hypothetical protein
LESVIVLLVVLDGASSDSAWVAQGKGRGVGRISMRQTAPHHIPARRPAAYCRAVLVSRQAMTPEAKKIKRD